MGEPKKIAAVFGTRPEAIKVIPVILELAKYPQQFKSLVVVTAQHRSMLDQVLDLFKIRPDYDLDIMEEDQGLVEISRRAIEGLDRVISEIQPDLVLVHGDTTTTFIAALSAYYHRLPIAHLEAGLRTYDKYNPYPEELNRHLVAVLSDLHFAPTTTSRENLLKEGIHEESIFVTGNTVIDALLAVAKMEYQFEDEPLNRLNPRNRLILVTAHRRENWGSPLESICKGLKDLVHLYEDIEIVYPVHLNPNVQEVVGRLLSGVERIHLASPLDYQPFVKLMDRSYLVLTDSGGIQEEAPSLGKPVLVLRKVTERPEAVRVGTVKVIGTAREEVVSHTSLLLDDKKEYDRMAKAVNPYGDGKASTRVVEALSYYFGFKDKRPEEFGC